jgi:hypothetical protein
MNTKTPLSLPEVVLKQQNKIATYKEKTKAWREHYRNEVSKVRKLKQEYIRQEEKIAILQRVVWMLKQDRGNKQK